LGREPWSRLPPLPTVAVISAKVPCKRKVGWLYGFLEAGSGADFFRFLSFSGFELNVLVLSSHHNSIVDMG
jgi:hypothetical protein